MGYLTVNKRSFKHEYHDTTAATSLRAALCILSIFKGLNIMFQTIGHKSGGFVQIASFGGIERITAQHSYQQIGGYYKTVAGAKRALTMWRKQWLKDNQGGK